MGMLPVFVSKVFTNEEEKLEMMELFGLAIPAALSTASESSPSSLRREQRDERVRMEEELERQRLEAIRVAEEEREALRVAEEQERLRQQLEEESRAAALREQEEQERFRQQLEEESRAAALRVAEERRRAEENARLAAQELEAERIRGIGRDKLKSLSAEAEQIMAKAEYQPGSFTRVGEIKVEICGSSHPDPDKDAACKLITESSADFYSKVLNQLREKIQGVRDRLNAATLEGLNLEKVGAEISQIDPQSEFEELVSDKAKLSEAVAYARHLVEQRNTLGTKDDGTLKEWQSANLLDPQHKDLAEKARENLVDLIQTEMGIRNRLRSLLEQARQILRETRTIGDCGNALVQVHVIEGEISTIGGEHLSQAATPIRDQIRPVLGEIRSTVSRIAREILSRNLLLYFSAPSSLDDLTTNIGPIGNEIEMVRSLGLEELKPELDKIVEWFEPGSIDLRNELETSTQETLEEYIVKVRQVFDANPNDVNRALLNRLEQQLKALPPPQGDGGNVSTGGLEGRSNQPASSATQPALATERGPDVDSSASSPGWGSTAWGILTNPVGSIRNAAASKRNAATSIRGALEGAVATGGIADSMGI
jgi:hypothetical protein